MTAHPFKPLPAVVAHADWSVNPKHRWMAVARLGRNGVYQAEAPEPVGELATLLERLRARAGRSGPVLLGLDLPVGLPRAYAARAGIEDFMAWFAGLGEGRWAEFHQVAKTLDQVTLTRPFYPMRPGETDQKAFLARLGFDKMDDLRRRCDFATADRGAAAPIFWTLGPQQVGKAALNAWPGLLFPALRAGTARFWPFQGSLGDLLAEGGVVVAETYPGEIYGHFGIEFPDGGKGSLAARRSNAARLFSTAQMLAIALEPGLQDAIAAGFHNDSVGDDRFDASVGLFGMINVLRGHRTSGEPDDPVVRRVEGWILGQDSTG